MAVGRLVEKKGFEYLILACQILVQRGCQFHCEIIGTGELAADLQSQIEQLNLQGHQVELFATRLGGEPPTGLANLTVHQLPQLPKGDVAERENAALAANLDLRFALEREAPFDLIYERYSLWSFTGIEYAQTTNIPSILEVNAPLIEEQREHRGLINLQAAQRVAEVGQLTELIEHQINGLLCPPGDPVSLAACLERLRSQPEFRRRLGQTARMRVQKHHTWEAVVKRLLNLADGTEIDGEIENLTAAKPKIASGR